MRNAYEPSARELAGQDEVHLTSGELAEMLREAKTQAWDEGALAVMGAHDIGRTNVANPYAGKS